jgi:hypothetical protein
VQQQPALAHVMHHDQIGSTEKLPPEIFLTNSRRRFIAVPCPTTRFTM